MNALSSAPPSSAGPSLSPPDRDPEERLRSALTEAREEVSDALDRLEMARTDAHGENAPLDAIELLIEASANGAERSHTARAQRIAASVADDLETVVARLRRVADSGCC